MNALGFTLTNISKTYPGTQALKAIDFCLAPGEVHCVVGENGSGKSTLIKILSGVEQPSAGGEIRIEGVLCTHHDAAAAIAAGIQVIYQDMSLFPNLSVAENIAFTRMHGQGERFSQKKMRAVAQEALAQIGVSLNLDERVESLSIAHQQLVEIARSLTRPLKLLILDEPTASLTQKEVNALFRVIATLKAKGIAILFVSHKMTEVFQIAERITIFRDGIKIGSYLPEELDADRLVFLMSGQMPQIIPPTPLPAEAKTVLEVQHLSRRGHYKDISFSLRAGEVLGITGLLGSGRTELALSLIGMNPPDDGHIYLKGEEITQISSTDACAKGICYVSEDRRHVGLVLKQSIEDNLCITSLPHFLKSGLLRPKEMHKMANGWVAKLKIKIPALDAPIDALSGGNQQKVVLGKWLALSPKVLILDQPTIGIDVIAKQNIHSLIKKLAEGGMSILLISDEVSEAMRNSHRLLVMRRGEVVHECVCADAKEEAVMAQFHLA